MSQYYEINNRDAQACSFAGNGTVNPLAPSASAANAAASSCIPSPTATFTPTAPAGGNTPGATGSSGNGGGSGGTRPNSGSALYVDTQPFAGVAAMAVISLVGGIWTLL